MTPTADSLPDRVDVVVIGAGAVGAATAWYLTEEKGLRVAVLEARAVAAGSTSRSAAAFRQQFGNRAHVQMSLFSRKVYEAFPAVFGGAPVFLQHGYLFLYSDAKAMAAARARVDWQVSEGVTDAVALAPSEIDALPRLGGVFETDELAGATWCPTDGFLRPTEIASGFVEGARRRGASLHVGARVTGIESKHGRVTAVELDGVTITYEIGDLSFDNQIEIEGTGTRAFSDSGDSGSLIVDDDMMAAALLFAGGDHGGTNGKGLTYANPIDAVMTALKVKLA